MTQVPRVLASLYPETIVSDIFTRIFSQFIVGFVHFFYQLKVTTHQFVASLVTVLGQGLASAFRSRGKMYARYCVFAPCLSAWPVLAKPQTTPDSLSVVPVVFYLFVVIAVIVLLASVLKKFNLGFPGSRNIKIVTALSLGTRERVVVIEVGGKQHMLGVTPHQINHLMTLDEPLENLDVQKNGQNPGMNFKDILDNLSKKK